MKLVKKYGAPPFSVLDGRQQYWFKAKRKWFELLKIKKGIGREYLSSTIFKGGRIAKIKKLPLFSGSEFDPFLSELIYKWFSPDGGVIIDPFCGGPVRGLVASFLDRRYFGVDIREEQIKVNKETLKKLPEFKYSPVWKCGDAFFIDQLIKEKGDLLFSCPPYFNLEKYSNLENDLSTFESFELFIERYEAIIRKSYHLLKDDSFAVWVVGEVRDKKNKNGRYFGFVYKTIEIFQNAGFEFYNDMVYITPYGVIPLTVEGYFSKTRKVGKTHQNVLVFLKGDARKATKKILKGEQ